MEDGRFINSTILSNLALEFLTLAQTHPPSIALERVVPDLSRELLKGGSEWFSVVVDVLSTDANIQCQAVKDLIIQRLIRPVLSAFKIEVFSSAVLDALYVVQSDLPRSEALWEYYGLVQERLTTSMTQQIPSYRLLPLEAQGSLVLPLLLGADLIKDSGCFHLADQRS